jgi:mRNA-degrading endonuclease toxin of MazEF toxin-antitoxin module
VTETRRVLPRKGEIWDVVAEDDRPPVRVLIVSADEWHEGAFPQVVVIVNRHGMAEILPYIVTLADTDTVANAVAMMDSLTPVDPADLVECIGSVGGTTLAKVDDSIKQIFAL